MNILLNYLGYGAGEKLKQAFGWLGVNRGNNNSGFSATPGGRRWYNHGRYEQSNSQGNFWTSTEYDLINAKYFYFAYGSIGTFIYNESKNNGFSVRCLKE